MAAGLMTWTELICLLLALPVAVFFWLGCRWLYLRLKPGEDDPGPPPPPGRGPRLADFSVTTNTNVIRSKDDGPRRA